MKTMSVAVARATALGCAILACVIGAHAEDYPSHPITMIVPFAAGGPTDTLGRILTERMRLSLGQTIVIENVTGAGSTIGVGRAAQAAPDGYTLSLGNWTSFVGAGALYPTSYDLLQDFEPVSLLTFAPMLIVGKNALPVKDGKDLIAWLEGEPRQGIGSDRRRRQRRPRLRALFPGQDQHPPPVCALSRWGACDAGFGGWTDRLDVRGGVANADLCSQR